MGRTITAGAAGLSIFLNGLMCAELALAAKDQSRIESIAKDGKTQNQGPALPLGIGKQDPDASEQEHPGAKTIDSDEPVPIEPIELNDDIARRALDALIDLRQKYDGDGFAEYETPEEFVKDSKAGERLKADVLEYGFLTVPDWSAALLSIDYAYGAILDGEESDVLMQIKEVRDDPELSESDRKAMIDGLTAMLSTPGNKNVVRGLLKDATYADKLRQLEDME